MNARELNPLPRTSFRLCSCKPGLRTTPESQAAGNESVRDREDLGSLVALQQPIQHQYKFLVGTWWEGMHFHSQADTVEAGQLGGLARMALCASVRLCVDIGALPSPMSIRVSLTHSYRLCSPISSQHAGIVPRTQVPSGKLAEDYGKAVGYVPQDHSGAEVSKWVSMFLMQIM